MFRIVIPAASLVLLGVAAYAGYSALQACTLNAPALSRWLPQHCRDTSEQAALVRLAALRAEQESLLREIRARENELGKLQCTANHPEPPPIVLPPPEPEPAPIDESRIDEEAWRDRDLAALEGCWELDSNMRVTDVQTRAVTHFNQWNMCFDASGAGEQTLRATNGTTCESTVTGQFLGDGRLRIDEPGNLNCSNGMEIWRRVSTCTLVGNGAAQCAIFQPEYGGRDTVALRRAVRN